MSKYSVDSYNVTTFNEVGARILKVSLGNVGLVEAIAWAREQVESGAVHSFAVERVLFNSAEQKDSWKPKAEKQ